MLSGMEQKEAREQCEIWASWRKYESIEQYALAHESSVEGHWYRSVKEKYADHFRQKFIGGNDWGVPLDEIAAMVVR